MPTRKKMGHARETVAKATKGLGKKSAPKFGKGNQSYRPKLHKNNKLQ